MRKYAFLLLCVVIAGCTNPQQDEQIRAFWAEQLARVLPRPSLPQQPFPLMPQEQPFAEMPQEQVLAAESQPLPVGTDNKQAQVLEVMLFIHPQAPEYARLRQEGFVENFQRQYAGKAVIKQYDVSTPAGQNAMRRFMQVYKISKLTVPALVIGNTILQYPFKGVDLALQKAFTTPPSKRVAVNRVKKAETSYQFMEITMEDEPSKVVKTNKNVSAKDRVYIQRALENARLSNQKTLRDIGQIFGPETQAQAFAIVAKSEKVLQTSAQNSESVQKYLDTQKKVLRQQEHMLNQLMQNNARNLRPIRG